MNVCKDIKILRRTPSRGGRIGRRVSVSSFAAQCRDALPSSQGQRAVDPIFRMALPPSGFPAWPKPSTISSGSPIPQPSPSR